jgi:hypothetical protein
MTLELLVGVAMVAVQRRWVSIRHSANMKDLHDL